MRRGRNLPLQKAFVNSYCGQLGVIQSKDSLYAWQGGQMHHLSRCTSHLESGLPGFPGGAVVKNPPANAEDTGSSPGPGRSHRPQSN